MTFFKELGVQSMVTQFCNRYYVLLYASNCWMGNKDEIEGSVDVCNSDSPLVAQSRKKQHCIPDNAQRRWRMSKSTARIGLANLHVLDEDYIMF